MTSAKTERTRCRFVINSTKDGKAQIVVRPFHKGVSVLANAVLRFDFLAGTTLEQAKKVAELLNENVLDVFVTGEQGGSTET